WPRSCAAPSPTIRRAPRTSSPWCTGAWWSGSTGGPWTARAGPCTSAPGATSTRPGPKPASCCRAPSGTGSWRSAGGGTPPPTAGGEFAANVRDQSTYAAFLPLWWPVRSPLEVLRSLADPERLAAAAGRDLTHDQAVELAASFAGMDPEEGQGELSYQDIA